VRTPRRPFPVGLVIVGLKRGCYISTVLPTQATAPHTDERFLKAHWVTHVLTPASVPATADILHYGSHICITRSILFSRKLLALSGYLKIIGCASVCHMEGLPCTPWVSSRKGLFGHSGTLQ